jgi:hypothetical protein
LVIEADEIKEKEWKYEETFQVARKLVDRTDLSAGSAVFRFE